jgi:hypothetical protein
MCYTSVLLTSLTKTVNIFCTGVLLTSITNIVNVLCTIVMLVLTNVTDVMLYKCATDTHLGVLIFSVCLPFNFHQIFLR